MGFDYMLVQNDEMNIHKYTHIYIYLEDMIGNPFEIFLETFRAWHKNREDIVYIQNHNLLFLSSPFRPIDKTHLKKKTHINFLKVSDS
jgi:predicted metal-dependent RNase